MDSLTTIIAGALSLGFVCLIIYLANKADQGQNLAVGVNTLLYVLIGANILLALMGMQSARIAELTEGTGIAAVDASSATLGLILTLIAAFASVLIIRSPGARMWVQKLAVGAAYRPDSPVHTTALVLMLLTISANLLLFLLGGGIQGMATAIQDTGITLESVLLQQVLWLIPAFLGVGLLTRRSLGAVIQRLGLRPLTFEDLLTGTVGGAAGFVLIIGFAALWTELTPPDVLQEQTAASSQLALSVGSLGMALAISALVAVGEEIFFRGALQPAFGNLLTSLFFAAIHTQYALTPATGVIFIVSLGLGWLRSRYSTNSAVIAHFVYNFVQLGLAVVAGSLLSGT